MAELLLTLMGKLTNQIVDLYLAHQVVLNTLVVAYGLVLAYAHYNLQRVERFLLAAYKTADFDTALEMLARDVDGQASEKASRQLRIPVIASPFFFAVHRISRRNLISIVGRKEGLPRKRVAHLLEIAAATEKERNTV